MPMACRHEAVVLYLDAGGGRTEEMQQWLLFGGWVCCRVVAPCNTTRPAS